MQWQSVFDQYHKQREDFFQQINIDFWNANTELLTQAFIHKSFSADFRHQLFHNERLEFVGDGILGAVINKLLFLDYPKKKESDLTLAKILLVKEKTLAIIAQKIQLDKYILISNWEEKSGGRQKPSILGDCLEALIGYIYLDYGYDTVEKWIETYVYDEWGQLQDCPSKSYKTLIQELLQKQDKTIPEYIDTEHTHDDKHNVIEYKAELIHQNKVLGTGYGPNKKTAQEYAAKQAYIQLNAWNNATNK
jgi:ribonuclease III